MRDLVISTVVVCWIAGCAAVGRPVAGPTESASNTAVAPIVAPVIVPGDVNPADPVPLSIQRIVSEQRREIHDVITLTAPLEDARGRARATGEATALASELVAIEAALAAAGADSDRYDETVVRLQRLATRVGILHEALFGAVSATNALEVDVVR